MPFDKPASKQEMPPPPTTMCNITDPHDSRYRRIIPSLVILRAENLGLYGDQRFGNLYFPFHNSTRVVVHVGCEKFAKERIMREGRIRGGMGDQEEEACDREASYLEMIERRLLKATEEF